MPAAPVIRRSLVRAATATVCARPFQLIHRTHARRWNSTAAANPKLTQIVDQISTLTLLETADLVGLLKEKTLFNVKLKSFEATAKPKIIKEVKALLGLSLVDSKKFVEAAPKMLKEGLTKDEAEKLKTTLEGLGAKVELE
ncbi:hypothetical protein DRE_06769 [Drechslerella stenobrocha 248]|uniref:Ribosomal protein L7/L12 C-terminal domain-containing protein n=1 Tax=Drechslerella stenobrocha 248 TaxID=1043628 RepID=W7HKH9_9PEZI|nr:hypothetical protein DRE_06769 [Drechslerella stenobrocha 248]